MPALAAGKHHAMASAANQRIQSFETDRLAVAIQEHGSSELAKDRALQLLSESPSWTTSNEVIEQLIISLSGTLTPKEAKRIIGIPADTGADLPGSAMYGRLLSQIDRLGVLPEGKLGQSLAEYNGKFMAAQLRRARVERG